MRTSIVLLFLIASADARAARCVLDGEEVNTDNGSTTAGKSGMLRCYRDGKLWREQELVNGAYLGLDRRYDDDGSVSERRVNGNGNSHGPARDTWPDGKPKREATYDDGSVVGLSRSWHPNGRIAALRFTEKGVARGGATLEYNAEGQLTELRCGTRSLLQEDRAPCGFDGKTSSVTLYTARGEKRAELALRDGQVLSAREFARDGRLAAGFETTAEGRVERRYHEDGQVASERVVADGYYVAEREWYMNGRPKTKTTREKSDRYPKTTVERFRDTGVLASRSELAGDRRLHEQTFDERGAPKEEFFYDAEGALKRHRAFAADGSVSVDEELYPDGSRKSILGQPTIAK